MKKLILLHFKYGSAVLLKHFQVKIIFGDTKILRNHLNKFVCFLFQEERRESLRLQQEQEREQLDQARSQLTSAHQLALTSLRQDHARDTHQLEVRLEQSLKEMEAAVAAWSREKADLELRRGQERTGLEARIAEAVAEVEARLMAEKAALEAKSKEDTKVWEGRLCEEKAVLEAQLREERTALEAQLSEEKAALEVKFREEKAALEERLAIKTETRKGSDHRIEAAKSKVIWYISALALPEARGEAPLTNFLCLCQCKYENPYTNESFIVGC